MWLVLLGYQQPFKYRLSFMCCYNKISYSNKFMLLEMVLNNDDFDMKNKNNKTLWKIICFLYFLFLEQFLPYTTCPTRAPWSI